MGIRSAALLAVAALAAAGCGGEDEDGRVRRDLRERRRDREVASDVPEAVPPSLQVADHVPSCAMFTPMAPFRSPASTAIRQ
jgi:hypothetical protein